MKTTILAITAAAALLSACAPDPAIRVTNALVNGEIPAWATDLCGARGDWAGAAVNSRYAGEMHATAYSYTRHSMATLPAPARAKYLAYVDIAYSLPYETNPVNQRQQAVDLRSAVVSMCLQEYLGE